MSLHVDIEKHFEGFSLKSAFSCDGGVTGILGASGCGKSMTLRCIAGVVKPDRGRIELDGTVFFDSEQKINLKPQQRHVGLLFQNYALFPNMNVRKNLMTGLLPYEKDKVQANRRIDEMIVKFHLEGLENHLPAELSGGQQQRVALARILLTKPRMLMLDEPFSALDDYLKWKVELELRQILDVFEGNTLFVSHSRDEVYRICDRVCVMDHGRSGEMVPVREMFENPRTKAASLLSGCKNYSRAENVVLEETQAGKDEDGAPGAGHIFAADWGVTLSFRSVCPPQPAWIGVRSHYVHLLDGEPEDKTNVFACEILQVIEDVFGMTLMVRPLSAPLQEDHEERDHIRMDLGKEEWNHYQLSHGKAGRGDHMDVRIDPADVMVLEN